MSIYDYTYTSIEGKVVDMSAYKGQVLLIVNTASKCGFTPQYEGLEALHQVYSGKGLTILGFPSGQFNDQELETNDAIHDFCKLRYGVTFPMSQKIEVRGENADPLFKYLIAQKGFEGMGKGMKTKLLEKILKVKYGKDFGDNEIKWNFTKFLVDKEGNVVKRYESVVEPKDIRQDVEGLL